MQLINNHKVLAFLFHRKIVFLGNKSENKKICDKMNSKQSFIGNEIIVFTVFCEEKDTTKLFWGFNGNRKSVFDDFKRLTCGF